MSNKNLHPLLYSALQHPALLQCLVQCTEVTPYLLVMEFCPLVGVQTHCPCQVLAIICSVDHSGK